MKLKNLKVSEQSHREAKTAASKKGATLRVWVESAIKTKSKSK